MSFIFCCLQLLLRHAIESVEKRSPIFPNQYENERKINETADENENENEECTMHMMYDNEETSAFAPAKCGHVFLIKNYVKRCSAELSSVGKWIQAHLTN